MARQAKSRSDSEIHETVRDVSGPWGILVTCEGPSQTDESLNVSGIEAAGLIDSGRLFHGAEAPEQNALALALILPHGPKRMNFQLAGQLASYRSSPFILIMMLNSICQIEPTVSFGNRRMKETVLLELRNWPPVTFSRGPGGEPFIHIRISRAMEYSLSRR